MAILAELDGITGVLEVGPGPGVLTQALAAAGRKLSAIELDPRMVGALSESAPLAEVTLGDALQVDLGIVLDRLPEPRAIVSNMPYNITGPLLAKFAEVRSQIDRAVLMMQKEVGDRILAEPGDSNRGALSVCLQTQFLIRKVCLVPPGAFDPPPKVDSIVLCLVPKPIPSSESREARFINLVRAGFAQPRKTLLNNLGSLHGKAIVELALMDLGLDLRIRPHMLSLDQWRQIMGRLEPDHEEA